MAVHKNQQAEPVTWAQATSVFLFWTGLMCAAGLLTLIKLSGAFVSLGNDVPVTTSLFFGFIRLVGRSPWVSLILIAACFAIPLTLFRNRKGIKLGRQFGIALAITLAVITGFTIFGLLPVLSSQDVVR